MPHHPTGAGKSSYDLIDHQRFWSGFSLKPGMTIVDLACGAGRYATEMAGKIGPEGRIIAIDLWEEGIAQINRSAQSKGLRIETHVVDVGNDLPVADRCVDLCLMATVLHDLVHDGLAQAALRQVARILKPAGILSVIEFKKQDGPPGPPRQIRLRLEEVSMLLLPVGLIRFSPVVDLGPDLWFAEFKRLGGHSATARPEKSPE
jgi:ubiquinone/menaquinone biosynthesis C-methylase UbiE